MALYCAGFAGYLRALLPWHTPEWSGKAIGIGHISGGGENLAGTSSLGRSEILVFTVELAILGVFVGLGPDPRRPGDSPTTAGTAGSEWCSRRACCASPTRGRHLYQLRGQHARPVARTAPRDVPRAGHRDRRLLIGERRHRDDADAARDGRQPGPCAVGGGPADPRARRLRGDRGGRAAGYGLPRERHDVRRRQPCLQGVEVW